MGQQGGTAMKHVRVWLNDGKDELFKDAKDIQNNGLELSFNHYCSLTNSRMSVIFQWDKILGYAVTED